MPISAEVITDSISPAGHRLTTFKLRYPKFIHGEFMTHRVISRNASSSRAIPVAKLIREVEDDALRATPVYWGREQNGMQSGGELSYAKGENSLLSPREEARQIWASAAYHAAGHAQNLVRLGVHKSIVNRILEPFSHINVVATATEWANFFGLRLHKDAQPEMRALAIAMWEARKASTPKLLQPGDWHLPFVFIAEGEEKRLREGDGPAILNDLIKVSVARCARVSYESFETDKRSSIEEDLKLYDKLVGAHPLHASPAEHQATPDIYYENDSLHSEGYGQSGWLLPDEHGNFVGWRQYRKMLPGEAVAPLPAEFS